MTQQSHKANICPHTKETYFMFISISSNWKQPRFPSVGEGETNCDHCYNQPLLSNKMYHPLKRTSAQKDVKDYAEWKELNRKVLQESSLRHSEKGGDYRAQKLDHRLRGHESRAQRNFEGAASSHPGSWWFRETTVVLPYCIHNFTFCSFALLTQVRTY